MVIFVLVHNVLFGLACLLIAQKIWQFRCKLISITDTIVHVEAVMTGFFHAAPHAILKGQSGASQLRDRYQQLGIQFERIQQIMSLLNVGQSLWRYRSRGRRQEGKGKRG